MLTGISGSNTVDSVSMIRGLSAAVRAGSLVMPSVIAALAGAGGTADGCWTRGSAFMIGLLSRHDVSAGFGSGTERVPRQRRALDPHRKLADTGQHRELAEILDGRVRRCGDRAMEALEQCLRLGHRLPLHAFGHERRRRLRDGTAGSLKRRLLDDAVVDAQIHRQAIAAEGVVAFSLAGIVERAKIPGPPVVIQDHFLVELLEIGHHANTSRTLPNAAASASISSRVL